MMKIYGISGLGADERVFDYLKLDYSLIPLLWITQLEKETIEAYSLRLAEKIDTSEEFILLAVSFGGLVAVEISKVFNPKLTILISSIETRAELPLMYKFAGRTKILNLLPKNFLKYSNAYLVYLFGTKREKLLKEIIADSNVSFSKWAILELVSWKNSTRINNIIKISGSKDRIIPMISDAIVIKNGGHFMIVDRADEISSIINEKLKILK